MEKLVQFLEVTSAQMASLPVVDGRFIFVTDKGLLYRDTNSAHVLVSGPPVLMQITDNITDTMYQTLIIKTTDSYMNISVSGAVLEFSFIQ